MLCSTNCLFVLFELNNLVFCFDLSFILLIIPQESPVLACLHKHYVCYLHVLYNTDIVENIFYLHLFLIV